MPTSHLYSGPIPLSAPLPGATIGQACGRFWRKYGTFSGRATRSEFWWCALVATVVAGVLITFGEDQGRFGLVVRLIGLSWCVATVTPTAALLWRRLHDTNRSGLWMLVPAAVWHSSPPFLLIGSVVNGIPTPPGEATLVSPGAALLLFGALLVLAGFVVTLALMAPPSDPGGARFDRVANPIPAPRTG